MATAKSKTKKATRTLGSVKVKSVKGMPTESLKGLSRKELPAITEYGPGVKDLVKDAKLSIDFYKEDQYQNNRPDPMGTVHEKSENSLTKKYLLLEDRVDRIEDLLESQHSDQMMELISDRTKAIRENGGPVVISGGGCGCHKPNLLGIVLDIAIPILAGLVILKLVTRRYYE